MPSDRAKVTVSLTITAVVEVADNGYLGTQETVAKHLHKAKTDAQGWRWFVQKGGLEPEEFRATVELKSVTIIPN